MTEYYFDRRRFLTACAVGAVSGCAEQHPEARYNDKDITGLSNQYSAEAARGGFSPFGVHRYQGYQKSKDPSCRPRLNEWLHIPASSRLGSTAYAETENLSMNVALSA